MKTQLRSLLIFLCVLLFPMSAFANLEIKSENIIFYGDVKPADGERLVRNLEIYRATILAFSKVDNRPDKTPLTIYAFKNATKLNKFAASKGYAGLYTQGTNGPIFLTISKGGFKDDKWSSQVALHEYSHHVVTPRQGVSISSTARAGFMYITCRIRLNIRLSFQPILSLLE